MHTAPNRNSATASRAVEPIAPMKTLDPSGRALLRSAVPEAHDRNSDSGMAPTTAGSVIAVPRMERPIDAAANSQLVRLPLGE
jgi:hypothetical protein